jgi:hypothetical protein
MAAWMLYVMVVSLLLGAAALAAERAVQLRKGATRWLWGASLAASLALPLAMSSVSIELPRAPGAAPAAATLQPPFPLRRMTIGAVRPAAWLDATIGPAADAPYTDATLAVGWAAASALMLGVMLFHGVQAHRRRRAWPVREIAGAAAHVSEDIGPAVIGLIAPRIVVPRWIAEAPAETQVLVMAHERAHLDAGDARLLALAVLLITAMPWNLPLWWQLRRLRFAIETDCDARVLRAGHDLSRYGETLILVGERQSRPVLAVAAMSEPTSFLEQRIRKMLATPKKTAWGAVAAMAGLGFVLAASAAEVSPPNAPRAAPPGFRSTVIKTMRYKNHRWGFAVEVPSRWNEFPPNLANSPYEVVRFQSLENGRHNLIVFRGPYDPAAGPEAVAAGTAETLARSGFAHFVQGEAKLASGAIRTLDFDQQRDGRTWSCRYYFFPEGSAVYILAFGTTDKATMFPQFDVLAASFGYSGEDEAPAAAGSAAPAAYVGNGPAVVAIRVVDDAKKPGSQRFEAPDGSVLWLEPDSPLTGPMFASASTAVDEGGRPAVKFSLTPDGASRFAALTRENVGRRLAIVINGKVVWAPRIRDEIGGGKGLISGRFTVAETEALARDIRSAAAGR